MLKRRGSLPTSEGRSRKRHAIGKETQAKDMSPPGTATCKSTALSLLSEMDMTDVADVWAKLSSDGCPRAQYSLGMCFDRGHGRPADAKAAADLFRKAARRGHAQAQFQMGLCCDKGIGFERDLDAAFYWWSMAAKQSLPEAQQKLGACYENGQGVERDVGKAIELYQQAAASDHPAALFDLGRWHEEGFPGVLLKDKTEAMRLFALAAQQGHLLARMIVLIT